MSTPPAHRRLVPRQPRPPSGPDDHDETKPRDLFEATIVDPGIAAAVLADAADSSGSLSVEPRDSMFELTLQRPRLDLEDLEVTDLRPASAAPAAFEPPAPPAFAPPAPPAFAPPAPPVFAPMPPPPGPGASFSELEPTTLHAGGSSGSGIEDRPTVHLSPAEYGLLAAIAEGHEPSRLRYADWLERRSEPARAEMLRIDHALHAMAADDLRFIPMLRRLREVAARVSVDWRSRVSRAAIEGCGAYSGACPGAWRALPPTGDDVRTCGACGDKVYYCVSLQLAQERVQHGQLVALDLTCERWPQDLDRQCDGCATRLPPHTRFCPHCGRALPRAQSLG